MGNLLGEPFKKYVQEQIKVRQKVHGKNENRSPKDISYLNSKNAWVKLSSAVFLEQSRIDILKTKNGESNPLLQGINPGMGLAKKYVMYNGLSSVNETTPRSGITSEINPNGAYGVGGNNYGYSPMPGIISANIKDLGRGSLKEATISLKAHNPYQFDILETLYMRLGYYVLLEWGNDRYLDPKSNGDYDLKTYIETVGEKKWWDFDVDSDITNNVLFSLEEHRKINRGNYDALFATITNFSWQFQKDGTYDIDIKLMSVGDVIESLKINTPADAKKSSKAPSPTDIGTWESIKTQFQGNPMNEVQFYEVLYPGLKNQLNNFYDSLQNNGFNNVFGGIDYNQNVLQPQDVKRGYDKMFSLNALKSSFSPRILSIIPPGVNFKYDDSDVIDSLVEEQKQNSEIINNILVPFSDLKKLPKTPSVDSENWVIKFFTSIIRNLNDYYPESIVKKIVTKPSNVTSSNTINSRTFQAGLEGSKSTVTLQLVGGAAVEDSTNTIEFDDANIKVNWGLGEDVESFTRGAENIAESIATGITDGITSVGSSIASFFGNDEAAQNIKKTGEITKALQRESIDLTIENYKTESIAPVNIPEGIEGYDDNRLNRLKGLGKGYKAEANKGWSGVKNGWFMLHLGLDEFLQGGDFAFTRTAPPLERGPISLIGIIDPNKIKDKFANDKIISELFFLLCDKEKFFTYVYNLFVEKNAAGGKDDPRFAIPEENPIQDAAEEYDAQLEEKRNKSDLFNWFYNIRALYPLYTYTSLKKEGLGGVANASLEVLPKVQLWEKPGAGNDFYEAGRIINPFNKTSGTKAKYSDKEKEVLAENKKLAKSAENSNKSISPSQKGLKSITSRANITPTEAMKNWNKEIGFPNYQALSKDRDFAFLFLQPIENSYFVRLGVLLDYIEKNVVFKINDKSPSILFDTDQDTNICYTIDNVISTNITKCIIANPNFFGELVGSQPQYYNIFKGLNPFVATQDGYYYGKIMNIYFSFNRVEEIMEKIDENNTVDLFSFLKDITNDINECTGNITNIEPVIDKDTNTIKFIDQTTIPGLDQIAKALGVDSFSKEKNQETILNVFGYKGDQSNFIRNINLTTTIDKNYTSMITIGATANGAIPGSEATALSKWNVGIKDRFKNLSGGGTKKKDPEDFKAQYKQVLNAYGNLIRKKFARCGINYTSEKNNLIINQEYINSSQDIISNYYKFAQAQSMQEFLKDPTRGVESSLGFIPFNLGLEMDGISGIRIYNRVRINTSFLPSNYGDSLDFIVSGINHKIENNEWITNLEAIATSKYKNGS